MFFVLVYTYNYVNFNLGGQVMLNASTSFGVQAIIMSVHTHVQV